jgi:hypothetical protein
VRERERERERERKREREKERKRERVRCVISNAYICCLALGYTHSLK